jgi:hypothetical protein
VLALAVLLSGCVGVTDRDDFAAEVQRRGGGVTSDLVSGPMDQLRDRLGDNDPELLALSITPASRYVALQVRDPDERGNVDDYVSRNGHLGDPAPVRVSATDDLDGRTFRVSQLPALDHLEDVADDSIAALGFDDAYVTSIDVSVTDGTPGLRVSVGSPRATGTATFNADGQLLSAVRA